MRFGTWNTRSLYRTSSLQAVESKLAKYKLDLLAVQDVIWDKDDSQAADDYKFFYGNGKTNVYVHQEIRSAGRRVEFITDKMYIILMRSLV
jgi:hypothetical protein